LPLHRVLLPWAQQRPVNVASSTPRDIPEIAGGNWQHGRDLFFGRAGCAVCHQANGKGGNLGPDLGNLVHRDYASVLQDIVDPNAALNPDYLAVTIKLRNGETAGGVMLQSSDNKYVFGQPNGEKLTISRDDVEPGSTKPLGVSLMPPGLLDALSESERKDLLTFLLLSAPAGGSP
jgi:putative heme-binding domain-containing protein